MWRRVYCIEFDCGLHALFLRHVRDLTSGFVPNMLLYIHEDGRVNPLKRSLWCEWWQWCYIIKLVNMGADAHVCFKVWVPPLIVYTYPIYWAQKMSFSGLYCPNINDKKQSIENHQGNLKRLQGGEKTFRLHCRQERVPHHLYMYPATAALLRSEHA